MSRQWTMIAGQRGLGTAVTAFGLVDVAHRYVKASTFDFNNLMRFSGLDQGFWHVHGSLSNPWFRWPVLIRVERSP